LRRAEMTARKVVIRKYGLAQNWKPAENLGLDGQKHDRDHVLIEPSAAPDEALRELTTCLTTDRTVWLFQGCMQQR
jgi:hypothetical protein